MVPIDISGDRYGKLLVIDLAYHERNVKHWRCLCDCGAEKIIAMNNLRAGKTKSCGCSQSDAVRTHSMTGTPEYSAWDCMLQRCLNKSTKHYHRYGGRGITVFSEWVESFESFYSHIGNRPSSDHSVDRINNDGNYEPGNVRWATKKQQQNNRCDNHRVEYNGENLTLMQWSDKVGINYNSLRYRISQGWTIKDTFEKPVRVQPIKRA